MSKRTNKKKEKTSKQHTPSGLQEKSGRYSRLIAWGLVIAAIVFIAAIRIRLLSIPLERDEGEFAYMGQLMLQGIPPYSLAANMKLPGTYAAYALIMALFGQTVEGIHLGLLLINLSTMLLVFVLTQRLFDDFAGVVACAAYDVKIPFSWLRREESEMLLLNWFENYRKNYTTAGIAEIVSARKTKYLWDEQAQNYHPQSDAIFVLRRNPE